MRKLLILFTLVTASLLLLLALVPTGAGISTQDRFWRTPLSNAVGSCQAEVETLLHHAGTDIDAQVNYLVDLGTSLHATARADRRILMTALRKTSLHSAASAGQADAEALLDRTRTDIGDRVNDLMDRFTSLPAAVEDGNEEVVARLLDKGTNPNTKDNNGMPPLHHAAQQGHVRMATLLLEHGANPGMFSDNRAAPLHLAARRGHDRMTTLLLEHGANPNAKDGQGEIPLHHAVRQGHARVVTLLLAHSANPNAVTDDRATPLHLAAWHGHDRVATLLLEHGANPVAEDRWGDTPSYNAAIQGHTRLARVIEGAAGPARSRNSTPDDSFNAASILARFSTDDAREGERRADAVEEIIAQHASGRVNTGRVLDLLHTVSPELSLGERRQAAAELARLSEDDNWSAGDAASAVEHLAELVSGKGINSRERVAAAEQMAFLYQSGNLDSGDALNLMDTIAPELAVNERRHAASQLAKLAADGTWDDEDKMEAAGEVFRLVTGTSLNVQERQDAAVDLAGEIFKAIDTEDSFDDSDIDATTDLIKEVMGGTVTTESIQNFLDLD